MGFTREIVNITPDIRYHHVVLIRCPVPLADRPTCALPPAGLTSWSSKTDRCYKRCSGTSPDASMQHSLSARLPSSRVACVPRAPRVVQTRALPPQGLGLDPELRKTIDEVVAKNKARERTDLFLSIGCQVVAFIKGTRQFPQCGFSNTVCQILTSMKVPYETVNILENERLRSGTHPCSSHTREQASPASPRVIISMKEYSQWPTFPQVYVGGEFVGGCDIMILAP
ncbi:hypothetical protein QJQ45_016007 [Haematococcus lacustris]|nr:hypothetical protein QJQ45_016007 [Haematococcus lacustris]